MAAAIQITKTQKVTVEILSKILVRDKDAASLKSFFIRPILSCITQQQETAKQSTTWESILGYTGKPLTASSGRHQFLAGLETQRG